MHYAVSLATILLAVLLGAMSPGPSFLIVARVSMSQSRRKGVAAALGMGTGAVVLSLLAVLGMQTIFAAYPQLYRTLQLIGGIYLLHIGFRLCWNASAPVLGKDAISCGSIGNRRLFCMAFLIQISNPKTIVFYSSIFASLLPGKVPTWIVVALPMLIFLVESGWYSLVSVLLSANTLRTAYIAAKTWIDRIAGGLILYLGAKLLMATLHVT